MICPSCHQEIGNNTVCPYCGQQVSGYYAGSTTIVEPKAKLNTTNNLLRDIKLLLLIIAVLLGGLFFLEIIDLAMALF